MYVNQIQHDPEKQLWTLTGDPAFLREASLVFQCKIERAKIRLRHSGPALLKLRSFKSMFVGTDRPILTPAAEALLEETAKGYAAKILTTQKLLDHSLDPRAFTLRKPPYRDQAIMADIFLRRKSTLCADELGLGKTVVGIAGLSSQDTIPGVVVCKAGLVKQWQREIRAFHPFCEPRILQGMNPTNSKLGAGSQLFRTMSTIYIVNYQCLAAWSTALAGTVRSIIFDEIHLLRNGTSTAMGQAAYKICRAAEYRMGLSATPVVNYGDELWNIYELLEPGLLGPLEEFRSAWCRKNGSRYEVIDPVALGMWLRKQGAMVRRTRSEAREIRLKYDGHASAALSLEEADRIEVIAESIDEGAMQAVSDRARYIAEQLMGYHGVMTHKEKFAAGQKLQGMLRQATGIAKADYVAGYVEMLLETGEPIVLFGYHKGVYEKWQRILGKYKPGWITGEESSNQKDAARARFMSGDTNLIIMSLESAEGVDGLQNRCATIVIGELATSPTTHDQAIGRILRQGQTRPCVAYFVTAQTGSDPYWVQKLGVKKRQVEGVRNLQKNPEAEFQANLDQSLELARTYLSTSPTKTSGRPVATGATR